MLILCKRVNTTGGVTLINAFLHYSNCGGYLFYGIQGQEVECADGRKAQRHGPDTYPNRYRQILPSLPTDLFDILGLPQFPPRFDSFRFPNWPQYNPRRFY